MIPRKKKLCKTCKQLRYMFGHGNCESCARKGYKKPKPISDKRKVQIKEYSVLRKEFLTRHPNCQAKLIGCQIKATDVHHANGRTNEKLNDTSAWLALCRSCHDKTHGALGATEARRLGLKK